MDGCIAQRVSCLPNVPKREKKGFIIFYGEHNHAISSQCQAEMDNPMNFSVPWDGKGYAPQVDVSNWQSTTSVGTQTEDIDKEDESP